MKELLPLSIEVTPYNDFILALCYLCFSETGETELKIGQCEVHEYNLSTKIWRNYLSSLTINIKDFEGDPIISIKSAMNKISKCNSIWFPVGNDDLVNPRKYRE